MRRKLFTLAAGVSAVLCTFSLGFGLLGYRQSSDTRLEWIGRSHAVASLSYDTGWCWSFRVAGPRGTG